MDVLPMCKLGLPNWPVVKNPPANVVDAKDLSLIPGLRRSPGGRNGNPFQCSLLDNSMDRGAWQTPGHGVIRIGHDLTTKPSLQSMDIDVTLYTKK